MLVPLPCAGGPGALRTGGPGALRTGGPRSLRRDGPRGPRYDRAPRRGGSMTDWKLARHPAFAGVRGPVVVCVMDGVGIGRRDAGDAVWLARKPNLDWLARAVPS